MDTKIIENCEIQVFNSVLTLHKAKIKRHAQTFVQILTRQPKQKQTKKQKQTENKKQRPKPLIQIQSIESVLRIGVLSMWYVIMSHCQHGSPWPSLASRLYRALLPQGYILYWHIAVVYRFLLVFLPLLVQVRRYRGVCRLWVRPYFSSSVPHVWFISLG